MFCTPCDENFCGQPLLSFCLYTSSCNAMRSVVCVVSPPCFALFPTQPPIGQERMSCVCSFHSSLQKTTQALTNEPIASPLLAHTSLHGFLFNADFCSNAWHSLQCRLLQQCMAFFSMQTSAAMQAMTDLVSANSHHTDLSSHYCRFQSSRQRAWV